MFLLAIFLYFLRNSVETCCSDEIMEQTGSLDAIGVRPPDELAMKWTARQFRDSARIDGIAPPGS